MQVTGPAGGPGWSPRFGGSRVCAPCLMLGKEAWIFPERLQSSGEGAESEHRPPAPEISVWPGAGEQTPPRAGEYRPTPWGPAPHAAGSGTDGARIATGLVQDRTSVRAGAGRGLQAELSLRLGLTRSPTAAAHGGRVPWPSLVRSAGPSTERAGAQLLDTPAPGH